MIKKLFITLFLLGIVVIGFKYFLFITEHNNKGEIPISNLKNGDLVLRCGRSTESYAVYLADKDAEFSHIGIIQIDNNIPYVIHAVPHKLKTIKKETLQEFLKPENASKYAIYRTTFSQTILNKVVNEANQFYTKKLTFDDDFDLKTNNKLYCTELIVKAFKNAGVTLNIKTKNLNYIVNTHAIIFPSEFTKKPIFNKLNIN
ncbi:YiiX/YebB-like N1pC/P60 family cysteine hydrolase [Lutibacter sp. B1]|uniref:YiiX/YebB-like N1pC/P60 family cysteine hydrolase n=1 Tax=Lutibacter sp. B1 TaxID=2725996 RepID=UPI001456767C|nr:YiiX/YebB-like N1pC/P60 family cysteine hydrolase [Lutibacter sp. B1]NLP56725.1 hypothetical protein [Lutibacter sp. B1]